MKSLVWYVCCLYCVQSVRIRSFTGLYFAKLGLNTERYWVQRDQSEFGKTGTSKNPNMNFFTRWFNLIKHRRIWHLFLWNICDETFSENSERLLAAIFSRRSIIDVSQVLKYASVEDQIFVQILSTLLKAL